MQTSDFDRFLGELVVLELSNVLAGPAVGMFFAELGARVIKVENPALGGDTTRKWKLLSEDPDTDISAYFSSVNWGKESIAIDLKNSSGSRLLEKLIARADILLTSFKPGDAEKLGIEQRQLLEKYPRLIHAAISAYGDDDSRPGFDAIIQAETGFMSMNGTEDSGPVKMPVALIDLLLAHQLKEALLLALLRREFTGSGGTVSINLLQSGIASLANQATNFLVGGEVPVRKGSDHPNIFPYGTIFTCADGGEVVLAVGTDSQFRGLCRALDLDDLADNPHYATNRQRVQNRPRLKKIIAAQMAQSSRDVLLKKLLDHKVPAGAVLPLDEVFAQAGAREMLIDGLTADKRKLTGVRSVSFTGDGLPWPEKLSAPPALNQHGRSIVTGFLGLSPEEYQQLVDEGALLSGI
jgi:crotonobetainyl-CoA:carnitine CoA-transferase CaiB-like acyl-CoA transferase